MHTGILHTGHAVVAYLLPWFQGVSLDLNKKLSATLVLAFLLGLSYSKEKKPTHQ